MKPINFPEANLVLGAPKKSDGSIVEGYEDCQDLPLFKGVCNGKPVLISCWELNEAEKAEIANTGQLWVYVYAYNQPPIGLATGYPFPNNPYDVFNKEEINEQ